MREVAVVGRKATHDGVHRLGREVHGSLRQAEVELLPDHGLKLSHSLAGDLAKLNRGSVELYVRVATKGLAELPSVGDGHGLIKVTNPVQAGALEGFLERAAGLGRDALDLADGCVRSELIRSAFLGPVDDTEIVAGERADGGCGCGVGGHLVGVGYGFGFGLEGDRLLADHETAFRGNGRRLVELDDVRPEVRIVLGAGSLPDLDAMSSLGIPSVGQKVRPSRE